MALDPLTAVLNIADTVVSRVFPDPTQAATAKLELIKLQQSGELTQIVGQMDINKAEAGNASVFVSGWRPFIGWTCGAAFAYKFVLAPAVAFGLTALGHPIELPVLDFTEMSTVLLGMLGLGGMRSLEKIKGVA